MSDKKTNFAQFSREINVGKNKLRIKCNIGHVQLEFRKFAVTNQATTQVHKSK